MIIITRPPTDPADQPMPGCVIAAVYPATGHLDQIVTRAVARAAETGGALLFLTVAKNHQVAQIVDRMRARLRGSPHPVHLVATWIDGDQVPHSAHPELIAAAIIHAARRLSPAAVVLGHNPANEAPVAGVLRAVVAGLPHQVEVLLGTPACVGGTDFAGVASTRRWTQTEEVHLTDCGRRHLAASARHLERRELPAARRRTKRDADSPVALMAYEDLLNDYRTLMSLVANAPRTADLPDDPDLVELGEHVELAANDGTRRRLVVVADIEATRGRACAAASSRLGQALLGHRVGEWTSVPTPRGARPARILAATR
jgi:transcription elongation GreA/GreB family factor